MYGHDSCPEEAYRKVGFFLFPEVFCQKKPEISQIKYKGDRRTLVAALETILGIQAKYENTPSFAYDLGGEYKVLRDGTLIGSITEELRNKLAAMGFEQETADE